MQVTNNTSPSFGSIQVALSKMDKNQRGESDKLYKAIKYDDKYSPLAEKDVDIYILPSKTSHIEVRYMDPYSGKFYRKENGEIIKHHLKYLSVDKFWEFVDKVVNTYCTAAKEEIKRPEANIHNVIMGNTEMTKINPQKTDDILYSYTQDLMKNCGFTQKEAEDFVFDQYTQLYHTNNKDADF